MSSGDNRYRDEATQEPFGKLGAAWLMDGPNYVSGAIEKVMDVNRRLIAKIEILHIKVGVDARQREITIKELQESGNKQVHTKDEEIRQLKSDLEHKDAIKQNLQKDNQQKASEIQRLRKYTDELKEDVEASKKIVEEMQRQLDKIPESSKLKPNKASADADKEIAQLRAEVNSLKDNLAVLESELSKAKDKISEQQGMILLMEKDTRNAQRKFQDDLAKVKTVVRDEIEKLRDLINSQWMEMREIRLQNEQILEAVNEIKSTCHQANCPSTTAHADRNVQSTVPTLPALGKNDKGQTGRRN